MIKCDFQTYNNLTFADCSLDNIKNKFLKDEIILLVNKKKIKVLKVNKDG